MFVSASPDDAGTVDRAGGDPGADPHRRAADRVPGLRPRARPRRRVGGRRRAPGPPRPGTCNAVDLGGHPSATAGSVRWGRALRRRSHRRPRPGRPRGPARPRRSPRVCDLARRRVARATPLARPRRALGAARPGRGRGHPAGRGRRPLAADRPTRPLLFHAGVGATGPSWWPPSCSSALGVADADLPFFPTRAEVLADLRDALRLGRGATSAAPAAGRPATRRPPRRAGRPWTVGPRPGAESAH